MPAVHRAQPRLRERCARTLCALAAPATMLGPAGEGRAQRAKIAEIHHENEVLKMNLAREARTSKAASNSTEGAGNDLLRLQKEADAFLRQIGNERRIIEECEQSKDMYEHMTNETAKNMGGIHASTENQAMVSKQLKLLQNKLDKATMNFNHADAENKQLRADIDALRKQVRASGRSARLGVALSSLIRPPLHPRSRSPRSPRPPSASCSTASTRSSSASCTRRRRRWPRSSRSRSARTSSA